MTVLAPKEKSFVEEIIESQTPQDKLQVNLFGQFLKATEEQPPGGIRAPAPAFITKMLEEEKHKFQVERRIR